MKILRKVVNLRSGYGSGGHGNIEQCGSLPEKSFFEAFGGWLCRAPKVTYKLGPFAQHVIMGRLVESQRYPL